MNTSLSLYKKKIKDLWPDSQEMLTEFIFYIKETLNIKDTSIYLDDDYYLSKKEQEAIEIFIKHKKDGVPFDYIVNKSSFYGNDFYVDSRVLIPRPETELLVDYINKLNLQKGKIVLDAGTGSGCIGITLAIHNPDIQVFGIDFSKESLEVAQKNKNNLKVNNFSTIHSDWLSSLENMSFDVIVSNPPYISPNDPHLKDLEHEPLEALVALDEGLQDFKTISKQAYSKLRKGGMLIFEHGFNQAKNVSEILKENGFDNIESFKDHQSHLRITKGII